MLVAGVVLADGEGVRLFDAAGLELAWNERVVCTTGRDEDYGRVVQPPRPATAAELAAAPGRVVRRATADDMARRQAQRAVADRALRAFRRAARSRQLDLKPYAARPLFDGSRVTITFGADDRIDVRSLATELGRELGVRIDLRQVRARDGARAVGGVGLCGTTLCSTRVPATEAPVTLRMAKDQDLPINPGRVTGLCGRLRCCLAFEHPTYRAFRDRAPAVGRRVVTARGAGVVRAYRVPADAVVIRLEDGSDVEVALDDLPQGSR